MKHFFITRKTALALAVATMFGAGVANAADYNAQPVSTYFDWTGPYVGAHIGGSWFDGTDNTNPGTGIDGDGVIGGILGGYNWQSGNWVFGGEVDFSFSGADAPFNNVAIASADQEWLASVRARLGYAWNNVLLFATAGVAFSEFELDHAPANTGDIASETHTGFIVGGGIEWAHWDNVSIRAEYLFTDFGDENYGFIPAGTDIHNIDIDENHILRAAIVWHFGN